MRAEIFMDDGWEDIFFTHLTHGIVLRCKGGQRDVVDIVQRNTAKS